MGEHSDLICRVSRFMLRHSNQGWCIVEEKPGRKRNEKWWPTGLEAALKKMYSLVVADNRISDGKKDGLASLRDAILQANTAFSDLIGPGIAEKLDEIARNGGRDR